MPDWYENVSQIDEDDFKPSFILQLETHKDAVMETTNYGKPASYHGNPKVYKYGKDGSQICYFNPLYDVQKLNTTTFNYLFPVLAEECYNEGYNDSGSSEKITELKKLADLMLDAAKEVEEDKDLNANIPAGFTYFGQFIDHDITAGTDRSHPFEITKDDFDPIHPHTVVANLINQRTPFLDLDSVYGGPGAAFKDFPQFYMEDDPLKFKIGFNAESPGELPDPELELDEEKPRRDLPRIGMLKGEERRGIPGLDNQPDTLALIGDIRNDENLIIAQFHLAFLKAHNNLIDEIRSTSTNRSDTDIFMLARQS